MQTRRKTPLLGAIRYGIVVVQFVAMYGFSATLTATNASSAAVQAAIDAAVDGDTVVVPAGNVIWSTQVAMGSKGITLLGAGMDRTVIVDGMTASGTACLLSDSTFGKAVRISGLTFIDGGPGTVNGLVGMSGARKFRIDHCRFSTLHAMGLKIWGDSWGVIDHCVFDEESGVAATGVSLQSDGTLWATTAAFGTVQATFIEDCSFSFTGICNGAVDSYNGARWVFRHNAVTNTYIGSHGCDSGGYRSTFSVEAYDNTFVYAKSGSINCYMQSRGGAGVYYGNNCYGNVNTVVLLQVFRFPNLGLGSSTCALQLSGCQPWGEVTGSNHFDGNILSNGYPALDQCGWTGPTTFLSDHSVQVASPVYSWSNRLVTGTANYGIINTTESCVQSNRDFFDGLVLPGYRAAQYPHPLVGISSNNLPPVILARAIPDHVAATVPVAFSTAASYDPEGVSLTYSWSFGDGVVSADRNPSHAYQTNGTYKVRLDVSDGINTASTNLSVTIQ